MATYKYTDKDYYYYDETLTQTLLNQYVSSINPANSSGTHFVYLKNDQQEKAERPKAFYKNRSRHKGWRGCRPVCQLH